jgi:pyrimidine deaminase RibD-like protein
MQMAIDLARRAQGQTSPNPPVGAIIVKDGHVVGNGWTGPAGEAHAEIMALSEAGKAARDSTMYVSLEPCSHLGRTPPCVDAVIAAGIVAAHIAIADPNPLVDGAGIRRLEDHGISVTLGECADQATELVEAHIRYSTQQRPFVTLLLDAPASLRESLQASYDARITETSSTHRASNVPNLRVEGPGLTDSQGLKFADMLSTLDLPIDVEGSPSAFDQVLAEFATHEITSCLVLVEPATAQALIAMGTIDKILAGRNSVIPAGFLVRRAADFPEPHLVLYPAR